MKIKSQHVLTGNELSAQEIITLLDLAREMKKDNSLYREELKNKHVALIFEKPSLRTRFSFTAAVQQLGGQVIESIGQNRKTEEPKDLIRVLQGYCDAVMIRTFSDRFLEEMQQYATIPIINGLTDLFHPCQTLADLLTLKERFARFQNLKISYLGDGNNVLHSLLIMATKLGIEVHYCCPDGHAPNAMALKTLEFNGTQNYAKAFRDPKEAVRNCHAVYTDVWTSMGFAAKDESIFSPYQVNEDLMSFAEPDAIFMHCMPMVRGKEVSENLPDQPCSAIFQQSENRLHVQKALLVGLV